MLEQLENYTDDQLMAIITQAHKVLDQRDRERRNEAAKRIRQLAAEVGLSVEIKGAKKRRGRPRKPSAPPSEDASR